MFINMTPHSILIPNQTLEPCGIVARCDETSRKCGEVDGVDVLFRDYGTVTNLLKPMPGVFLVVSHMCRVALPERGDLLSPGDLVRDKDGNIVGCLNFIANASFAEQDK